MKPISYIACLLLAGVAPLAAALNVVSVGPVAPASPSPRTTPVVSVDVQLSEACKLSTFTVSDLALRRDGINVTLTTAVTIASNTPTQYRINGLSAFTGAEGSYVLTVNAANIQDLGGANGAGGMSVSWIFDYTIPLYESDAPIGFPAPVIDATAFVNRSQFSVISGLQYDFGNCLFFTNTGSGVMTGNPGFRFDFVTNYNGLSNAFRFAASWFVNEGLIQAATNLLIFATNIYSPGELHIGAGANARLYASNCVDVSRSGLRAGPDPDVFSFFGGLYTGGTFINDPGVTDLYWGRGQNNQLNNQGPAMFLLSFSNFFSVPNFGVPATRSPSHQVLRAGSTATNSVSLPGGLFTSFFFLSNNLYHASVFTNQFTPTNRTVQMVFVQTNQFDTNFTTQVGFEPTFSDEPATAFVQFALTEDDIVLQRRVTNYVNVIDASPAATNITLQRNFYGNTFRPSTVAVTRGRPFTFFVQPTNATFAPELIDNPNYRTNRVIVRYAAYSAQIGEASTNNVFGSLLPTPPVTIEPTNMAGRFEIIGDKVNLDQARVRTESLFSVRTRNLTSNQIARVDAPFLIYDLGTQEPTLLVTNLIPADPVRRLSGTVSLWSGTWTNFETVVSVVNLTNIVTNVVEIRFHALILDRQLQTQPPVVLHEFGAHATNVVIAGILTVAKSLFIEATNLHIIGRLTLPPFWSWGASNVQNLVNFTNDGSLIIPGAGRLGAVPSPPYSNVINRGFVNASTLNVRTLNFENSGSLTAGAGILSVDAVSACLSNGLMTANGDIQISADNLTNRQTTFTAGASGILGALILTVTNRLTDGGTDANNRWIASAGFRVTRKPASGDLLGTRLESRIERLSGQATHIWPAMDMGASTNGFTNNLALGRLVLNGTNGSLFAFSGAGTSNALYVDYLDLQGNATNYDTALSIAPNLVIYFAHASVPPPKLNGRHGGRLRWVSTYAGPNSTTNIFYPSTGQTYAFNLPLAQATDFDSDGDNIANIDDPEPFFVSDFINFQFTMTNMPPASLLLSWNGLANLHPPPFITNYVEINTNGLGMEDWQPFMSLTYGFAATNMAPVSVTVSLPPTPVSPVFEPVPLSATNFVPVLPGNATFRVRIDPLQPPLPDP